MRVECYFTICKPTVEQLIKNNSMWQRNNFPLSIGANIFCFWVLKKYEVAATFTS